MASHSGPNIIEDGILMYLDASNSKSYSGSGSTWYDITGNGNNGTISGCEFPDAANATRIFSFDGIDDYVSYNDQSPYPLRNWWDQAWTVEYWMKADAFGQSANGGSNVVGCTTLSTTGEAWSFGPEENGEVQWYYWNGSIQTVASGKTLSTGQWYHLVFVFDGSTGMKIFVDGTLEKSASVSGTPTGTSTTFSIGKITSTGDCFDGDIATVCIYKGKALSATEVRQNYNALKLRVESWESAALPKYKTTFCAQINYDNDDDPSDEKTSFLVTNDDFANVTVFDNKSYIQGSGTQNPCFTTDTIYQHGYWSQFKAIQFDPTITFSTPTTTNTDPQSFAWDPNYPDNLFGVRWSGSMRYTTDKSSPTWLDSTLENSSGVTTSASGYNLGAGYLKDVGIIAVKNWASPDILRLYKSTDGGVNFTEYQVANWTSWGGQSGAYADFDGGKFMIWGSVNSTNSCVSSSDGVNWSVASTSGNIPGGSYRGWLPAVYNKHTSKFYTAKGSTSIGISTDGITWTTDTVSNTTYNVVPLDNGDMVGMHIDGSDAKFTKYPRSGTTVDWSDPTLIKTVEIATNFGSLRSYELGLYGPYPFQ